jgi:uncharacterized protein
LTLRVPCPRCGAETDADEKEPLPAAFPFCSERCRLIDLGKWFDEEYRIAGPPTRTEERPPHPDDE